MVFKLFQEACGTRLFWFPRVLSSAGIAVVKGFLKFPAAALVLVLATISIWHWRFETVPGVLPELKLASPLVGWKMKPYHKSEVVIKNGKPVLRLERKNLSEKLPTIHAMLGEKSGLEGISAIHIRCKARWANVEVGPQSYMHARIVTMMRDREGKVMHPPDFGLTSGVGSRGWHHCESVFKITEDMEDFGVEISMLGAKGSMEVKDLSVVAVQDRNWVGAATVTVLAGWMVFVYSVIRSHGNAPAPWRAVVASAAVVTASWLFVFPQTKGQLVPIFEKFEIGDLGSSVSTAPPPPGTSEPPPSPPVPKVPVPPIVKLEPVFEKPVPTEPVPPASSPAIKPEPVVHGSNEIHKALRVIDRRFPIAHVGLFTSITLLVLFLTGRGNQWRVPLALAVLSELIPELNSHLGGWDDWSDVLQNFAGVGLAVLLWKYLPILRRLSSFPERDTLSKA